MKRTLLILSFGLVLLAFIWMAGAFLHLLPDCPWPMLGAALCLALFSTWTAAIRRDPPAHWSDWATAGFWWLLALAVFWRLF